MNEIVLGLVFAFGVGILLEIFNPEVTVIVKLSRENPFEMIMVTGLMLIVIMIKRYNTSS